jgi:UDP-N-acetylglucosamine--N-acetylmuramyl-(pentapeptide) pyrophosphoryl-undecaprenol N-acetylglucosamine transferase
VYPALTVWNALKAIESDLDTLWVGGVGGMEADLVHRAGIPYEAIPAAGVHGVGLKVLPGSLLRLTRGYFHAGAILRRFRPDVLFFTGGYVAPPVALAARTLGARTSRGQRIPIALYVPDIEPGLALKSLARFADRIAVSADASRAFFTGRQARAVRVTGYPVRPELQTWDRTNAMTALGLQPNRRTLLVFGGSLGSRSINRALMAALPELLPEMQIVHITGRLDWEEVQVVRQSLAVDLAEHYHIFPYLHEEMGAALTAADLVVSRAGASILGEYPHFGLPALLVPYPYAWRYQQVNAEHLARNGAAEIVLDAELPARLVPLVRGLFNDPERLGAMRAAMSTLAQPGAAQSIASLIRNLALAAERM